MQTPLTLTYSKPKNIILFIISLGFVVLGIFNIQQGHTAIGIFSIVFFGLCLAVSVINFMPGASQLILTEEGVEMTTLFKKRMLPWAAVDNFTSGWSFVYRTVYFNLNEEAMRLNSVKVKRGAFPDTYGMSAKALAQLLNEYKQKYS